MSTVIIKSNASASSIVLVPDMGIEVPASGGSVTITDDSMLEKAKVSSWLAVYLNDNAFGAGQHTLILNDGVGDISAGNAEAFLDQSTFDTGSKGVVLADGSVPFNAPVAGVDPTLAGHLATKSYVDGAGSGISAATHKTLLQLIHFIDNGPAEGFTTGATRTTTGTNFPSQVLWKRADTTNLVEKNITYTGVFPTTIEWKIYDTDGSTVLATVTDTVSYSGVYETGRSRAIA